MVSEIIVYGEIYKSLLDIQKDDSLGKVFKVYNKEKIWHTVLAFDDEYDTIRLYIKEGDEVINDQVEYTTYYEVIGVQRHEVGEMLSHLLRHKIRV